MHQMSVAGFVEFTVDSHRSQERVFGIIRSVNKSAALTYKYVAMDNTLISKKLEFLPKKKRRKKAVFHDH